MNKLRSVLPKLVAVFMLILSSVSLAENQRLFSKDILLGDGCTLKVRETKSEAVSIKLFCADRLVKKSEIPWAGIREDNIQKVTLRGNIQVYFITAWDRSSTYGAQTNIVVWKAQDKWSFVEAPFERGFVVDKDKKGVFDLIDYYQTEKVYRFDNGRFIEINKKN
jgi:hypothetical protein